MNNYLQLSKSGLKNNGNIITLHVVIGNESCDLDSAVSAITYAYLLHHELKKNKKDETELVVPVLNIPKEDYPIKTEVKYLFNSKGIEEKNIVFRDEIDLAQLFSSNKLKLYLVDHHILNSKDENLKSIVVNVIDHRPQEPNWPWTDIFKVIELVGCCCTLVTREFVKRMPEILNQEIIEMLHATIILDTINLSKEANRVTPLDVEMVNKLKTIGNISTDNKLIFEELINARKDISNLTSAHLLNKDLKIVGKITFPGLPILVQEYTGRSDALIALQNFCTKTASEVVVLMGLIVENSCVTRDIGVYNHNNCELAQKIVNTLKNSQEPFLDLHEVGCCIEGFKLFNQKNIKATRKHILPVVIRN